MHSLDFEYWKSFWFFVLNIVENQAWTKVNIWVLYAAQYEYYYQQFSVKYNNYLPVYEISYLFMLMIDQNISIYTTMSFLSFDIDNQRLLSKDFSTMYCQWTVFVYSGNVFY